MPKYIEPAIDLNAFNCPRCGALADQTWYNTYASPISDKGLPLIPRDDIADYCDQQKAKSNDEDDKAEWDRTKTRLVRVLEGDIYLYYMKDSSYCSFHLENVSISRCFSCKKDSAWLHKHLLHPTTSSEFTPNEDLNFDIKQDFLEATKIINYSARGAAALLRLCIQKLCIQLGEKGKNINADIASLVKKGLDPKLQKALDIVRITGNNAVHPGQIDLKDDKNTAVQLFNLINLVADTMISQPKHINELFEKLPSDAKEAIEKRDKSEQ